jgi:hypothetical protein
MSALVHAPLPDVGDGLLVLDATRRVYAGLARDRASYHLIQPARPDDPRVVDQLRAAGDLVCTCAGGTFRGTCYRTTQAEAFEAANAQAFTAATDPADWFATSLDSPAGAGEMVEAFRG